jgi:penicillin amidase
VTPAFTEEEIMNRQRRLHALMRLGGSLFGVLALGLIWLAMPARIGRVAAADAVQIKGLLAPARIVTDSDAIPHIFAANDHDAMLMQGYAHARDRFFQMDLLRHQAGGTSAELVGKAALSADVQLRTFGLRRSAEASLPTYSADTRALLDAYAQGVNSWLQDPATKLPAEYQGLELTKAGIAPWTATDSVSIAKVLAFELSFDTSDIDLTVALAAYQQAGQAAGFDGTALFFSDVRRSSPFDTATTTKPVRGFVPLKFSSHSLAKAPAPRQPRPARTATPEMPQLPTATPAPEVVRLAADYAQTLRNAHLFAGTLEAGQPAASNWVLVSGVMTASGKPMLANDPHLSLSTPPVWYEVHLTVDSDPQRGPMNVNGVSFAGAPGVILGCNQRVCWGATVNPMDVTDVYQERIVLDPSTLSIGTVFDNKIEAITIIPQVFKVNQPGNGVADDVVTANVSPLAGGLTLVVPRRNNGPIVTVDVSDPLNIKALSIQYAGWGPTRELQAFLDFGRAANVDDFRKALQSFTFGSENFGYADVDGNIAYFAGGEMPLREDLQTLGRADGTPPFLIRDGTHHFKNEWLPVSKPQTGQVLPYEILPAAEMPQLINPGAGYIVSANNDPMGTNLGNDPLALKRPGGGIYYLGRDYDRGFRAGQLTGLMWEMDRNNVKIAYDGLAAIQANNQMLDAQVFLPYIRAAFANAQAAGAPDALAALASDAQVAEAVNRLTHWSYNTPTGISQGYDPGDDPANLVDPPQQQANDSVAATIYSVWRGQMVRATIDAALTRVGLGSYLPPDDMSLVGLRNLLDNFAASRGLGASGLNFFQAEGVSTPEAARDLIILRSLRGGLDQLASDAFTAAFAKSTKLDDYRWGKLHRIVFQHVLGAPFSIPTAGGFQNLAPGLPGVARAGGFSVPDASNHKVRVQSPNDFMFSSGPSRRFLGEMSPNSIRASQIIPGGQSGTLGSPAYASMLGRWLTNAYHAMLFSEADVNAVRTQEERFTP